MRELDTKRECALSRKRLDARGLTRGDYVAWATYENARTDGFSEMHRVAVTDDEHAETFCGEKIPASVCRVDFAVWPVNSFHPCKWCAKGYVLSLRESAA